MFVFIGISRQQTSFNKSRHEEGVINRSDKTLSAKKGSSLAVIQEQTWFKYTSKGAKEMCSSAMLHLNTVQYIFLLAFQVKSYREDHQAAAEKKKWTQFVVSSRSLSPWRHPLSTVITLKDNNKLELVCGFRINRNTSTFTYFDFESVLVVHKTNKNLKQSDVQYKSATIAT